MLKHTPRSGFAFLGSGNESVADHSFGAAAIGCILAALDGADAGRTALLCLIHDLHEAATGDFNYVNHRYDICDAKAAIADACAGTGLEALISGLYAEFEATDSREARLARDADQLDLICALRREQAHGNPFAGEWLKSAVKRIKTETGQKFCAALLKTGPDNWWYGQADQSWWINRDKTSKT
ncbi:MAG: HD domain-containing protein [Desulfovibrio sp.]|nr:HD domain-containing protein [Desulfovibrio sp.]